MSIFKKKLKFIDKAASPKIASVEARDFLPAFAHYNSHLVISKDGELMQTIRIDAYNGGIDYEPHSLSGNNLRESIRRAISKHITIDNFAVWIHTLRKRKEVFKQTVDEHNFAAYVNESWRLLHDWSHQYHNSIYITLVYDGQSGVIFDKISLKEGATPRKNREFRNNYLEEAAREMDLVAEAIIKDLSKKYQTRRLEVVERASNKENNKENNNDKGTENKTTVKSILPEVPVFYSEPMEFLSYLLNLRDEEVPLPDANISAALQSSDLLFGFNALETKSAEGIKRFGALLSLKQYREVPANTVDMLLQAPVELIISQAFHFISAGEALKNYRLQKEMFEISSDDYSMRASGLVDILNANRNSPCDYGLQQTTIMVLADELKKIDEKIHNLKKAFGGIGLVCVREDIRLEEIFWSIFPGNIVFLRRKSPIPTAIIGGFAKLNRFPSGNYKNTFWKEPLALIPTLVNSPYFFNFHLKDRGHTVLLDFNFFGDHMADQALGFLLTQANRLTPRIYYFDFHSSAKLFFAMMNGIYRFLRPDSANELKLNPFSLAPQPRNMAFLAAWCGELINASKAELADIKQAIQNLYAENKIENKIENKLADKLADKTENQPEKQYNLSDFVAKLAELNNQLADKFSPWQAGGIYGGLFSASDDDFIVDNNFLAVDLSAVANNLGSLIASFAYMLHRVIQNLDGKPTIIVLKNADAILKHNFFAERIESLLEMLVEQNAILISCLNYKENIGESALFKSLLETSASKIIIPADNKLSYANQLPELLSEDDQDLLHKMQRTRGDIMLKQDNETVALRIDLSKMPDIQAVYNNDVKTLISSGSRFSPQTTTSKGENK